MIIQSSQFVVRDPYSDEIFLWNFLLLSDSGQNLLEHERCNHYAYELYFFKLCTFCSSKIYASYYFCVYYEKLNPLCLYLFRLYNEPHFQSVTYIFVYECPINFDCLTEISALLTISAIFFTTLSQICEFIFGIIKHISKIGGLAGKNAKLIQIQKSNIINKFGIYGSEPLILFFYQLLNILISLPLNFAKPSIVVLNNIS